MALFHFHVGYACRNAAVLFFDAFPLQQSDASREDDEQLWQKQYNAIFTLLQDKSPAVRVVAVQGVCRLLNLFWEIIPASTARSFLLRLVDELVRAGLHALGACIVAAPLCVLTPLRFHAAVSRASAGPRRWCGQRARFGA